ncbi:MAG: hypothetical protein ACSHYB_11980 [Roseibacillus sp.]
MRCCAPLWARPEVRSLSYFHPLPFYANLQTIKQEDHRLDKLGRYAVRGVLLVGISAFLIALLFNFQLVMAWIMAFVILGLLGASAKIM